MRIINPRFTSLLAYCPFRVVTFGGTGQPFPHVAAACRVQFCHSGRTDGRTDGVSDSCGVPQRHQPVFRRHFLERRGRDGEFAISIPRRRGGGLPDAAAAESHRESEAVSPGERYSLSSNDATTNIAVLRCAPGLISY